MPLINPISQGVSISSNARGGYLIPPLEIKEGVVLGPMLLYIRIWFHMQKIVQKSQNSVSGSG